MNPYNLAAVHGTALGDLGWGFDSVSDEALEGVDLTDYAVVIWATGEESTADESFSDSQQALIRDFVAAGGVLPRSIHAVRSVSAD